MANLRNIFIALLILPSTAATHVQAPQYAIIGDAGKWNANTETVQKSIQSAHINHLILPGDNIYDTHANYESAWDAWTKAGFLFDIVAIGNHTLGYDKEMAFFKMPAENFAKVIGPARFLVLNSDNDSTAATQAQWLDGELKKAHESLIFLVYHHPSFSVAQHKWTDRKAFQLAIRPLLKKYRAKITSLLLGHDHVATLATFDTLPAIVSGAIQEQRPPCPRDDEQDDVKVRNEFVYDGTPTWAKLTLDSKPKAIAKVEFIRAQDGKLVCSVKLKTGQAPVMGPECSAAKR